MKKLIDQLPEPMRVISSIARTAMDRTKTMSVKSMFLEVFNSGSWSLPIFTDSHE